MLKWTCIKTPRRIKCVDRLIMDKIPNSNRQFKPIKVCTHHHWNASIKPLYKLQDYVFYYNLLRYTVSFTRDTWPKATSYKNLSYKVITFVVGAFVTQYSDRLYAERHHYDLCEAGMISLCARSQATRSKTKQLNTIIICSLKYYYSKIVQTEE